MAASTVSAAEAFEVAHNLILSWCTDRLKSRDIKGQIASTSYKEGAASELYRHARKVRREEVQAVKLAEKTRFAGAVQREREEEQARTDRLDPSNATRAKVEEVVENASARLSAFQVKREEGEARDPTKSFRDA